MLEYVWDLKKHYERIRNYESTLLQSYILYKKGGWNHSVKAQEQESAVVLSLYVRCVLGQIESLSYTFFGREEAFLFFSTSPKNSGVKVPFGLVKSVDFKNEARNEITGEMWI